MSGAVIGQSVRRRRGDRYAAPTTLIDSTTRYEDDPQAQAFVEAHPDGATHVRRAKARRAGEDAAAQVRETLAALSPADLLTRLGYVVEDAGLVPAGRLLLVRGAA